MATILVTGHRNPDLDSIGSAIAYAELLDRTDGENDYRPARLGEVNAQTAWALERAGAEAPELLRHVKLRVRDVMVPCEVTAGAEDPVRGGGPGDGRARARRRAGARRRGRARRRAERAGAGPALHARVARRIGLLRARREPEAVCEVLDGEILVTGDGDVSGRLWVLAMEARGAEGIVARGRHRGGRRPPASQLAAIELGVDLLVLSNGTRPPEAVVEARARPAST